MQELRNGCTSPQPGGPEGDAPQGGGDDSIETKDGPQDYLEFGSGNDEASVDLSDGVARNREIRSPIRLWSSYAL